MTHQEAVETLATERYLLQEMSDVTVPPSRSTLFLRRMRAGYEADAMREDPRRVPRPPPTTTTVPGPTGGRRPSGIVHRRAVGAAASSPGSCSSRPAARDLRTVSSVRVLHPVTLRPDSRGQEVRVPRRRPMGSHCDRGECRAKGADMAFDSGMPQADRSTDTSRRPRGPRVLSLSAGAG